MTYIKDGAALTATAAVQRAQPSTFQLFVFQLTGTGSTAAMHLRQACIFPSWRRPTSRTSRSEQASRAFRDRCPRCLLWVCAVTRRRFPVGANPTRQPLQPEAIGAVMEVTKWLKPSISVSRIGDSASVQAVTRVNVEQSSKRTMRRPTRQPFRGRLIRLGEQSEEYAQPLRRGSGDSMYTRKAYATREAPWLGR